MPLNNLLDVSVPDVDSAANLLMRDVEGNKNDTHDGTSSRAVLHTLYEHTHGAQKVYPSLADGVTLTTAGGDWVLGAITEIVPANAITTDFDIHEILVEDVDTQGKTYEVVLYAGESNTEVARTRFAASANKGGVPNVTVQNAIIAANSKISAALAIQDGGGKTAVFSIRYHSY